MAAVVVGCGGGKVGEPGEGLVVAWVIGKGRLVLLGGLGFELGGCGGGEEFGELEVDAGQVGVGGDGLPKVGEGGGVVPSLDQLVRDGLVHLGGVGAGEGEVEERLAREIGVGAVGGVEDFGVGG